MKRTARIGGLLPMAHLMRDEVREEAPRFYPHGLSLGGIFNFLNADRFWIDVEALRSQCDHILSMREVLDVVSMMTIEKRSDAWFAAHIGDLCDDVLKLRTEPRQPITDLVLRIAIVLGHTLAEWEWERSYKDDIIGGRRARKGAKRGKAGQMSVLAPSLRRRLGAMKRLVQAGRPISEAAAIVARQPNSGTAAANRTLWYRHHPKKAVT